MSAKASATRGGEPPSVANLFCQAVLQEQATVPATVAESGLWPVGTKVLWECMSRYIPGTIERVNGDGTYGIRMTSSALGLCTPVPTAGWIVATGRLVDGDLVRENVTYGCVGTDGMTPLEDGTYRRDDETGILTLAGPLGRLNHYHPVHDD